MNLKQTSTPSPSSSSSEASLKISFWTGSLPFFLVSALSLLAAALSFLLAAHKHLANPRVDYGLHHLPQAFLQIAIFAAAMGFAYRWLSRKDFKNFPASWLIPALIALYAVVWLPVTLYGGFAQDDWMLLAAAMVRKMVLAHPLHAFNALDTVDGNYRPLGTVLYAGYFVQWFGVHPLPFLLGNFFVGLACVLLVFAIMRELGQSPYVAAAASALFLSRDLLYAPIAWFCAMGDSLAILGSGLSILLLLRSFRSRGAALWLYLIASWLSFAISLFAKQSAFVTPLIAALAVMLRPNQASGKDWKKRLPLAALIGVLYAATVFPVYHHALQLFHGHTPYPIQFSLLSVGSFLSYITWYFLPIGLPDAYSKIGLIIPAIGLLILIALVRRYRRNPGLLGNRPALIVFLLGAAFASLSLFLLLPTRTAPYYGSMAVFWISMVFAIALSNLDGDYLKRGSRPAGAFLLCLLVLVGYSFVRLKQTGIPPSGSYIWGTYGMDREGSLFASAHRILERSPETQVVVYVGCTAADKNRTVMMLVADPSLQRILCYSPASGFLENGHQGRLPENTVEDLTDLQAYHWDLPMNTEEARSILAGSKSTWVTAEKNKMRELPADEVQALLQAVPSSQQK